MKNYIFMLLIFSLCLVSADTPFDYGMHKKWKVSIRENYKQYDNNKYKGLFTRELKGILHNKGMIDGVYRVAADIYQMDKSIVRGRSGLARINKNNEIIFHIDNNNIISEYKSLIFPVLKNILIFEMKEDGVYFNDEGLGYRVVNFYEDEISEVIPVDYTVSYDGKVKKLGKECEVFSISYYYDSNYYSNFVEKARGMHNVKYYIDIENKIPYYIEDKYEEIFYLNKGKTGKAIEEKRSGFMLIFYSIIESLDKTELIDRINKEINSEDNDDTDDDNYKLTENENGVSITLSNLQFKANSTELLPGEDKKVIKLISILHKIPDRTFLIVGHTASTGSPDEEMELSTDRAEVIAQVLEVNGISSKRIMFMGKGATQPIADNDTPENMRKNRRVEIIIMED